MCLRNVSSEIFLFRYLDITSRELTENTAQQIKLRVCKFNEQLTIGIPNHTHVIWVGEEAIVNRCHGHSTLMTAYDHLSAHP